MVIITELLPSLLCRRDVFLNSLFLTHCEADGEPGALQTLERHRTAKQILAKVSARPGLQLAVRIRVGSLHPLWDHRAPLGWAGLRLGDGRAGRGVPKAWTVFKRFQLWGFTESQKV